MAANLATYPRERCVLREEEHALLARGLQSWYRHDEFSDDDVRGVKAIFLKVFGLPEETSLKGSTYPDAIVLQHQNDERVFYALVTTEGGAWEAMELESEGFLCWAATTPFRLVLDLLVTSGHPLTYTTKN
jgi:hypothetical protein